MKNRFLIFGCLACSLAAAGCNRHPDNLKFVDGNFFGARAATAAAPGVKVGFASASYFNVPVVRKGEYSDKQYLMSAYAGNHRSNNRDAFSAFGSFNSSTADSICVGRVAATGYAARIAADKARRCTPQ